jgi:hypothetical protein
MRHAKWLKLSDLAQSRAKPRGSAPIAPAARFDIMGAVLDPSATSLGISMDRNRWLIWMGVGMLLASCTSDIASSRRLPNAAPAAPMPQAGAPSLASAPRAGSSPPAAPAPAPQPAVPLPPSTVDLDKDGFSPADGDCEEQSPQINPGAYDFPENGHDEDCMNGDATVAEDGCDDALAIDSRDPKDGARALGLCRFTTEDSKQWGVVSARYVQASGVGGPADLSQIGLLPGLGVVGPRQGTSMLAISSGVARAPDQPDYTDDCDAYSLDPSDPPDGYPKQSPACPDAQFGNVYDAAALELVIRTPRNAKSLAFDSNFYTYEYPDYICMEFNDFFVAMLDPKPAMLPDGNILFDQDGNPVSVNNSLLQVCAPGSHGGKDFPCPQGVGLLENTGFGGESSCASNAASSLPGLFGPIFGGPPDAGANTDAEAGAATGWLHTTAPVEAGSIITLRFAIWDSGDGILDSLALIDNFAWSVETPVVETKPVIPE